MRGRLSYIIFILRSFLVLGIRGKRWSFLDILEMGSMHLESKRDDMKGPA
jgi:hypothetical protein